MKNPFFSVIIPTYNRAEMLREAIQSVLEQSFKDFELIAVDDYSTDNTKEVVSSFHDTRIKYIVNSNTKGVAGARNSGIFMAKGQWISFLDSDDVWLPSKLEMIYKKIQKIDNTVGLIYTGFAYYNFEKKKEISLVIPGKEGWIQKDLLYSNYIGTFSVVSIRTDLLRKVGGCDERFHYFEDNDLYVRIAGLSKVAFIKEMLTYLRESNADRLFFQTGKRLDGYQLFLGKYKKIINKNPRLRHRISSLIFINALKLKNWDIVYKAFLWTFAGLFFDIHNFLKTFWAASLILSASLKSKN
jgi:glycosyltransferase involved in cell wall biosynthesis